MRYPLSLFALAVLLSPSELAAQYPCNIGGPGGPAFWETCPCSISGYGQSDINFLFQGQGRIGTVQSYTAAPPAGSSQATPSLLVIGTPAALPLPIPPGLVVCGVTLANVPTFHIDPLVTITVAYNNAAGYRFWLLVPNDPNLVGVTIDAQAFQMLAGQGSAPFVASGVIGFTIAP